MWYGDFQTMRSYYYAHWHPSPQPRPSCLSPSIYFTSCPISLSPFLSFPIALPYSHIISLIFGPQIVLYIIIYIYILCIYPTIWGQSTNSCIYIYMLCIYPTFWGPPLTISIYPLSLTFYISLFLSLTYLLALLRFGGVSC